MASSSHAQGPMTPCEKISVPSILLYLFDFQMVWLRENFKLVKKLQRSEKSEILQKECIAMFPTLACIVTRRKCMRRLHYQRLDKIKRRTRKSHTCGISFLLPLFFFLLLLFFFPSLLVGFALASAFYFEF